MERGTGRNRRSGTTVLQCGPWRSPCKTVPNYTVWWQRHTGDVPRPLRNGVLGKLADITHLQL